MNGFRTEPTTIGQYMMMHRMKQLKQIRQFKEISAGQMKASTI